MNFFFCEKLTFPRIFDGKLSTVLWNVKIWQKTSYLFIFFGKPMVFVSVAKSWVKLGPIFGVLVCTVGDLTKILVKFNIFEHFFGKISHCAISKDLIPSVFDRKFLTALWIVKIWPKLNLFLGKPKVFVSVAKSYWKKGQIFEILVRTVGDLT